MKINVKLLINIYLKYTVNCNVKKKNKDNNLKILIIKKPYYFLMKLFKFLRAIFGRY